MVQGDRETKTWREKHTHRHTQTHSGGVKGRRSIYTNYVKTLNVIKQIEDQKCCGGCCLNIFDKRKWDILVVAFALTRGRV